MDDTQDWVPSNCTLPTAERPVRVREFDDLFATSMVSLDRTTSTSARFLLGGGAGTAERARELAARETKCCSLFRFEVIASDDVVVLEITVPTMRSDVLDALTARARSKT